MLEETDWIIGGLEDENFSEILSNVKHLRDLGAGFLLDLILLNILYFHLFNLYIAGGTFMVPFHEQAWQNVEKVKRRKKVEREERNEREINILLLKLNNKKWMSSPFLSKLMKDHTL